MQRPSFQFYPADWLGNSNLRRCSHADKGAWIDAMCLMHDADEYGILRWPLKDIAQAIGCQVETLQALIDKGVMKGSDEDPCSPFIYTPRSGRKDGEPVTLIEAQHGPIWYSSRMVRDEYVRQHRGAASRFGEGGKAQDSSPKTTPMHAPKHPFGDGSSSSSSIKEDACASSAPPSADPKKRLFDLGVSILTQAGEVEKNARSFLAKYAKQDEAKLGVVLGYLAANPKVEPKSYIVAAFKEKVREVAL